MPRRLRKDTPGALHHVMSRGIARRTIFETRRDVRHFLSCLARQVRRGDLEVLAYSVLTTHFHLLVRSPRGRLSAAMQRVLDAYARWFNRGRRRDGPLFRGRFVNRLIETETHALTVLRYIDSNPVVARLVERAGDYPHGSAWHYRRAKGPPWLERAPVEGMVRCGRQGPWEPGEYERCFCAPVPEACRWLVDRRLRDTTPRVGDPLDELLRAAPGAVRAWMERKARLADGTAAGWPVATPRSIARCVARRVRSAPDDVIVSGSRRAPRREVIEAGLLRLCSGLRQEEIADRMGLVLSTAQQRMRLFARAAARDEDLLGVAAEALREALAMDYAGADVERGRLGLLRGSANASGLGPRGADSPAEESLLR